METRIAHRCLLPKDTVTLIFNYLYSVIEKKTENWFSDSCTLSSRGPGVASKSRVLGSV